MHAAWFWIDRWRKSTAYTDMTLAEMGAYRNLLDELWLRDGLLPLNERSLARAAGSEAEWPAVREAVLSHFMKTPEGWRNLTHDEVMAKTKAIQQVRADVGRLGGLRSQAKARANGLANANQSGNQTPQAKDNPPSPSPSPYSGSGSKEKKISKRQTASHGNGSAVADGFDRFWAVYPNKKGKTAAIKAWHRCRFSSNQIAAILATIAEQLTWPEWTKDEGRFIPHPATWLNRGHFNDEPRAVVVDPASDQAITAAMKALLKHDG